MLRLLLLVVFGFLGVALALNLFSVQSDLRELSDSLDVFQISSLERMEEIFVFGTLLPWFIAVSVVSALILGKLAYWTTSFAFSFGIVESVLLFHPLFQFEGTTFAQTLTYVFICNCAIPMSIAAISVTSRIRFVKQVRLSIRDLFAATVLVATLCGAIAAQSDLGLSVGILIASTWIAYSTFSRKNEAEGTNILDR